MDAYGNLQAQLQQIQNLMNRQPVQPQIPQKQITTIPEVDGLEGAYEFLDSMAPNTSAAVFDKHEQVFYGLAVDANGKKAPVKRCPFTVEDIPEPGSNTITKEDLEDFKTEIREDVKAEIRAALAAMTRKEESNEPVA